MTLDYAAYVPRPVNLSLWKTNLFCGAVPLSLGVVIFLLWLVTRAQMLQLLGFLVLIAGPFAFACGTICLAIFSWQVLRSNLPQRSAWLFRIAFAAILLLVNFPAAFAIIRIVDRVENRFTVIVTNIGTTPAQNVRVSYFSRTYRFGELAPGASVTSSIHARGGPVVLLVDRGEGPVSFQLHPHVDADVLFGSRLTLRAQIDDEAIRLDNSQR